MSAHARRNDADKCLFSTQQWLHWSVEYWTQAVVGRHNAAMKIRGQQGRHKIRGLTGIIIHVFCTGCTFKASTFFRQEGQNDCFSTPVFSGGNSHWRADYRWSSAGVPSEQLSYSVLDSLRLWCGKTSLVWVTVNGWSDFTNGDVDHLSCTFELWIYQLHTSSAHCLHR